MIDKNQLKTTLEIFYRDRDFKCCVKPILVNLINHIFPFLLG